jgi:hypothetical protein
MKQCKSAEWMAGTVLVSNFHSIRDDEQEMQDILVAAQSDH